MSANSGTSESGLPFDGSKAVEIAALLVSHIKSDRKLTKVIFESLVVKELGDLYVKYPSGVPAHLVRDAMLAIINTVRQI